MNASKVKPNNTVDPNAPYVGKDGIDYNPANQEEEEEPTYLIQTWKTDNANMRYHGFFNHGGIHPDKQPSPYGNTPMGSWS